MQVKIQCKKNNIPEEIKKLLVLLYNEDVINPLKAESFNQRLIEPDIYYTNHGFTIKRNYTSCSYASG